MKIPDFELNESFPMHLDQTDDLKKYREQFFISDENTIYLDGNSLGRLLIGEQKNSRVLETSHLDKKQSHISGKQLSSTWEAGVGSYMDSITLNRRERDIQCIVPLLLVLRVGAPMDRETIL